MLTYRKCLKNYTPLTYINENELLLSKKNRLYIYSLNKESISKLLILPTSKFKKIALNFKLLTRLLRLGIKYGISISEDTVIIIFNQALYEVNINAKTLKKTFAIPRGSRPLNISHVRNIEGFDDMVCFGEYFNNFNQQPVHIYKRGLNSWEIAFTFPGKTIEHIHAIIPDKFRKCLWILTGDFNSAAAIWMATDNFRQVTPILSNKQIYRSCVAFPLPEGLVYATDSQLESNSIRVLTQENGLWISKHILDINGPSIYGCQVNNKLFFSTSVEGISYSKSFFSKYLDCKPAPGVKDKNSYIIGGNLKEGFSVLAKNKKDIYPFILFQFGVIIFPNGITNKNILITYNIALKKHNMSSIIFEIG